MKKININSLNVHLKMSYLQVYGLCLNSVLAVDEVVTSLISAPLFISKVPEMTSSGGQRQLQVQDEK